MSRVNRCGVIMLLIAAIAIFGWVVAVIITTITLVKALIAMSVGVWIIIGALLTIKE